VRKSATWERILLFLSVALMESFRIRVSICADPRYSDIDGVVVAPWSRGHRCQLGARWECMEDKGYDKSGGTTRIPRQHRRFSPS
jgi:hypothetical protein